MCVCVVHTCSRDNYSNSILPLPSPIMYHWPLTNFLISFFFSSFRYYYEKDPKVSSSPNLIESISNFFLIIYMMLIRTVVGVRACMMSVLSFSTHRISCYFYACWLNVSMITSWLFFRPSTIYFRLVVLCTSTEKRVCPHRLEHMRMNTYIPLYPGITAGE